MDAFADNGGSSSPGSPTEEEWQCDICDHDALSQSACCCGYHFGLKWRNKYLPRSKWSYFPTGFRCSLSDQFVFMPGCRHVEVKTPDVLDLPYEDLSISTRDGVELHAYLIKYTPSGRTLRDTPRTPTILYFHGNAGNMGSRVPVLQVFYPLGVNVFLVDYRGYGKSTGTPTEKGFYLDAQATFDYLLSREDLDPTKIIVYGQSLGGAVAIDLASRKEYGDRMCGLILDNTFTNMPEVARHIIKSKYWKWLAELCVYKNKFDSLKKIPLVTCPTLFAAGVDDKLIPSKEMMTRLYEVCGAAEESKKLLQFPAGHNDLLNCPEYLQALKEVISEICVVPAYNPKVPPYQIHPLVAKGTSTPTTDALNANLKRNLN